MTFDAFFLLILIDMLVMGNYIRFPFGTHLGRGPN